MSTTSVLSPSQSEMNVSLSERFILAQVQQITLVFRATWVAEIARIRHSHILELPFYNPLLMGITHQNGQVLPLISAHRLLRSESAPLQDLLTIVRMDHSAKGLAPIGCVVDRVIGSCTRNGLPDTLFEPIQSSSVNGTEAMVLMQTALLPPDLWEPNRWSPMVYNAKPSR